jgi:amino acid transporter
MNKFKQETVITTIFILVLLALLNPFDLFMPTELVYMILAAILVVFGVYISFVIKEDPKDERERLHRYISNRAAYVFGSATLVIAVVYQGISSYEVDPWLLIVLGSMVVSKIFSLHHSSKHK